jgi:PIN domain nuclease of toxin-antitoxin system
VAEVVLDSTALIAFLRGEPGAEKVAASLPGSCICAVNLAEALSKMSQYGKPLEEIAHQVRRLQIPVIAFDGELAQIAASLSNAPQAKGLSLGDRACLALALKSSMTALTAEREWDRSVLGVKIARIR